MQKVGEPSILFYGDDAGNIHILKFLQPIQTLFQPEKRKKESTVTKVFWPVSRDFISIVVILTGV